MPDRTEPSKVEEHPVVPERTEPWRPLTQTEKNAWNAPSPEEREVCDALVHRLHREFCVKIVLIQQCWRPPNSCTARLARRVPECYLVLCPVERSWSLEQSCRWTISTGNTHEGSACQKHAAGGCLVKSGCGPDLANCTPSGTSWKCVSVGS